MRMITNVIIGISRRYQELVDEGNINPYDCDMDAELAMNWAKEYLMLIENKFNPLSLEEFIDQKFEATGWIQESEFWYTEKWNNTDIERTLQDIGVPSTPYNVKKARNLLIGFSWNLSDRNEMLADMLETHFEKEPVTLESLLEKGEVIAEYKLTSEYVLRNCIIQIDSTDISAALEDTLHRLIDAGCTSEQIFEIMGAFDPIETNESDIEDFLTIDLGYILPGYIEMFMKKLDEKTDNNNSKADKKSVEFLENKSFICELLLPVLQETRNLSDLDSLSYDSVTEVVLATFKNGSTKKVNVSMDSGTSMIRDILNNII